MKHPYFLRFQRVKPARLQPSGCNQPPGPMSNCDGYASRRSCSSAQPAAGLCSADCDEIDWWDDHDSDDRPRCCPVHTDAWLEYERADRGWFCPENDCEFLWLAPGDEDRYLEAHNRRAVQP